MSSSAITGPILSDVRRSPSGSAAAPSWSFAESTGTGVYLVSAGVLGLSTNGAQRVVVDAAGRVGIGGAPNDWGSNYRALEVGNDSGNGWMTGASGYSQSFFTVNSYFNGTAWVLKHNGQAKLFVMDPANNAFIFLSAAGTAGQTITWNEHMRIDSGGNLLVGQATTTNPPTAAADIYAGGLFLNPNRRTAANAASAYWEAATGVFYRSTSSIRYKTDVQDYTKGLTEVLSMRPVSFKGKEGPNLDKTFAGFIAEEIEQLNLKEFVEYDAEGRPDALAYSQFSALLVKAIQEQQEIIGKLEARLAALESK